METSHWEGLFRSETRGGSSTDVKESRDNSNGGFICNPTEVTVTLDLIYKDTLHTQRYRYSCRQPDVTETDTRAA